MRTILDIPDEQAGKLDALVKKLGTSRAALIRRGIELLLQEEEKEAMSRAGAFGIWNAEKEIEVQGGGADISEPMELNEVVSASPQPTIAVVQEKAKKTSSEDSNIHKNESLEVEPEALDLGKSGEEPIETTPEMEEEARDAAPAAVEEAAPEIEEEEKPAAAPAPVGGDIWPASFFTTVASNDKEGGDA